MRHRNARRKFNRSSSHARAMFSNMLISLITHRRIKTTEHKAREVKRLAEKAVTSFTRLGDLLVKDPANFTAEEKAKIVHAMRMAQRKIRDREAVLTLFNDIAPRYMERAGGYTRLLKMNFRKGDNAPMAIVEFVEAELPEREGAAPQEDDKKKGLLGKLTGKDKK